ncbi:MAG: hypothetical protein Q9190_001223 [Brigantiaea leucoxantha]
MASTVSSTPRHPKARARGNNFGTMEIVCTRLQRHAQSSQYTFQILTVASADPDATNDLLATTPKQFTEAYNDLPTVSKWLCYHPLHMPASRSASPSRQPQGAYFLLRQ